MKKGGWLLVIALLVVLIVAMQKFSITPQEEEVVPTSLQAKAQVQTQTPSVRESIEGITTERELAVDTVASLTEDTTVAQKVEEVLPEVPDALVRAREQQQVQEYYRAQQAASSPWRRSNGVSEAPTLTQAPSPIAVQANVLGDREDLLSTDAQRRNLKSRLAELAKLKERIQSGQYSMGDGEEAITAMQAQFTPPPEAIVGYTDENRYNASTEGLLTLPIGTIIPAVTVMKANSDRLGTFKAVVSQDVMDVTQTWVLIPKGSELIIKSFRMSGANEAINSVVGMSVPWIVLPDGNKIDTSKSSGLDREGMGGISDQVDHHWMEQFLGVAAYALVANNTSYEGTGNDSDSSYELEVAQGLRDQLAPHVQKYLQLRPTNVIRSGQSMNIIIEDEVFLKPWRNIYEDYL
ncbi:Conjugal transfer protein [Vibrio crassostreae]|nr:type IV secretion system protein VirB10 [Vibrio crassostreae]CAK2973437.1 Conjugal transfer protein [Vibrio crassostreae]CAK3026496.1 Conjugal transfer protein [Vibrio crassostreae]CAK3038253.1 Conjugal transfer protein [Vibrio crassostreae]CAK3720020.1 Conjugal transfer protein [Vibrio crassostreae]